MLNVEECRHVTYAPSPALLESALWPVIPPLWLQLVDR